MDTLKNFFFGLGIGICIIAAYLMVKDYVNWGIVTLIIGIGLVAVNSPWKRKKK